MKKNRLGIKKFNGILSSEVDFRNSIITYINIFNDNNITYRVINGNSFGIRIIKNIYGIK